MSTLLQTVANSLSQKISKSKHSKLLVEMDEGLQKKIDDFNDKIDELKSKRRKLENEQDLLQEQLATSLDEEIPDWRAIKDWS